MGYYKFRPSRSQHLLLVAALSEPEAAIRAWQAWQAEETFETTDRGSKRLMPLVYNNLKPVVSVAGTMSDLRGYYQHIRLTNKLLLFKLEEVLALLETHLIPALVLKGAALTTQVYRDPGLRPMIDLDVAVPRDCAHRIVDVLSEGGWAYECGRPLPPAAGFDQIRTLRFENDDGVELDLHFALFPEALDWPAVLPFWADAVPLQVGRQSALTLSATDHLLHVLVHGNRAHRTMPPIRWVADAVWLLRSEAAIDWQRLIERARNLDCQHSLSAALRYLVDRHAVCVPGWVMFELGKHGSFRSVLQHQMRLHPRFAAIVKYPGSLHFRWRWLFLHWRNYAMQEGAPGKTATIRGFLEYVRARWSARNLKRAAGLAVRRFLVP